VSQELLTLAQAAEVLQVKYERAADLARQGVLPVIRLGRQVRVSREQLATFISRGGRAWPGGWRERTGRGRQ
jgi:excisionase family DNA binding protein